MGNTVQMRAKSARMVLTGQDNAIPVTPTVLVFPGTSCTLDLSEDSENLNKLGNGVEPSRAVLSGVISISSNLEAVLNYETAAFMFGIAIGKPATTTESNSGDWADGVVVTVGTIVKNTTPTTDDLYCKVGGTTGVTAPDTTSSLQGDEIDDNGIIWIVHKKRIKEATSGIQACLPLIAIEYEFEDCDGNLMYIRTLGNAAASISTNIEKKTVPKLTVSTNGSVKEESIDNASYIKLMDMTPSATIIIDDSNDVRNSQLGFAVGASVTYPVFTFNITSDNAQEEKLPLNLPRYFTTGLRSVSGTLNGGWDADIYATMSNNDDSSLAVSYDDGEGFLIELDMANVTFPISAPTFEPGMVSNLDASFTAFGKAGVSGLVWKVRSLQVDY